MIETSGHHRVVAYPYTPTTPYRCGTCGLPWPCPTVQEIRTDLWVEDDYMAFDTIEELQAWLRADDDCQCICHEPTTDIDPHDDKCRCNGGTGYGAL